MLSSASASGTGEMRLISTWLCKTILSKRPCEVVDSEKEAAVLACVVIFWLRYGRLFSVSVRLCISFILQMGETGD